MGTNASGASSGSTPAREPGTQALDRGLAVLLAFTREQPVRKVSDVSRELGLHKSTTSRLFRALTDAGFLQRNPETGAYRLGVTVFDLGGRFLSALDLQAVASPLLAELATETGESVTMAVRDGQYAIAIGVARGTRYPQLVSRQGRRIPLWFSAAGRALLIDHEDDSVREILANVDWRPLTSRTVTDLESFLSSRVERERGWALNDEESETGLRVVAAPVRDHTGAVVASISVSAPIFRMDDAEMVRIAEASVRTAEEVSRQLGYGAGEGWAESATTGSTGRAPFISG